MPVAQLIGIASAPISRSVLGRALAKPTDRVIGRGQGRQPPKAVAHRASLEHGRSPVYFTPPFLGPAAGSFPGDVTITLVCAAFSPEPNNSAVACSLRHNLSRR